MSCKFHPNSCYDDNDLCPTKIDDQIQAIQDTFGYETQRYDLVSPKYLKALKKAAKVLNKDENEVHLAASMYSTFGSMWPNPLCKECWTELARQYNE